MLKNTFDFTIVGAGMVGLCVANQLRKKFPDSKIACIEKEPDVGLHSSGRNSGILHAGIYYKPDTIKAKVCVKGSRRLKEWIIERKLPLNQCGKLVIPQREELTSQLLVLHERAVRNGADVTLVSPDYIKEICPSANNEVSNALWSPNTAVTKPIMVVRRLKDELKSSKIKFYFKRRIISWSEETGCLKCDDGLVIHTSYVFNCAGLYADKVSEIFGIEKEFQMMPFKGLYWQVKNNSALRIPCNLYPVPDLEMPFLGVHFSPGASKQANVSIGPTATPALGRENYSWFQGINGMESMRNFVHLAKLYTQNKGGFKKYVHEQLLLATKPIMIEEAKKLVPNLQWKQVEKSHKIGIRPQLFDIKNYELVNDFISRKTGKSYHVLNAISPAFTASFELADVILDNSLAGGAE